MRIKYKCELVLQTLKLRMFEYFISKRSNLNLRLYPNPTLYWNRLVCNVLLHFRIWRSVLRHKVFPSYNLSSMRWARNRRPTTCNDVWTLVRSCVYEIYKWALLTVYTSGYHFCVCPKKIWVRCIKWSAYMTLFLLQFLSTLLLSVC